MSNHDNYDKNLLKALQDIAKSLRSIDSTLKIVNKEKTESDTLKPDSPMLPLNDKHKSILELDRKLTYEHIPHELIRLLDGWQIYYPNANDKILDVIEHYGSYGQENDQMEAMGYSIDGVKGYLDVDAALELFRNIHTERLQKGGEL